MPGLSETKASVLEAIPKGRDNARTAASIAEDVGVEEQTATSYQLRKIIKELVVEHDHAIGSCSHGYFLIASPQELEDCLDDLRQRKRGIQQRIHALREAYGTDDDGQHSLF